VSNPHLYLPCASEMIVILKQKADAGRKKLIPEKSGERYHKEMEIFRNWRQINGAEKIDENVVVCIFNTYTGL
jgi:hypothetical protein